MNLRDETYRIVGCAIEVLNTLRHGLLEKPYENALVVEFGLQQIPYQQQPICLSSLAPGDNARLTPAKCE